SSTSTEPIIRKEDRHRDGQPYRLGCICCRQNIISLACFRYDSFTIGKVAHWTSILLQIEFSKLLDVTDPVLIVVVGILLVFSLLSFTIIFSKLGGFSRARRANQRFLRAFRKSAGLDAVAGAIEQFRGAPLATVFDFGFSEFSRQKAARSKLTNLMALERSLQMGISEEITRLERNMNWLATTAAVCPFIGFFCTWPARH